jgi:plastocyanin
MVIAAVCLAAVVGGGSAVSGKVTVEGGPQGPVVVYIENVPGAAGPASSTRVSMEQKGRKFVPEVVVVQAGGEVDFPNDDKFYHNVFSRSAGNAFDLGLYRGGVSKTATLKTPGEVDVFCDIHPEMQAKILVVQNSFWVVAADNGTYTLKDVPPGSYQLIAWSAVHVPQKVAITVAATPLTSDFILKARPAAGAHLNKNGESYGRYK